MARRRENKKMARERAMAIAMLVLVLFISGTFIYADTFDGQKTAPKTRDVSVGYVSLEVLPPLNTTTPSSTNPETTKHTTEETK